MQLRHSCVIPSPVLTILASTTSSAKAMEHRLLDGRQLQKSNLVTKGLSHIAALGKKRWVGGGVPTPSGGYGCPRRSKGFLYLQNFTRSLATMPAAVRWIQLDALFACGWRNFAAQVGFKELIALSASNRTGTPEKAKATKCARPKRRFGESH